MTTLKNDWTLPKAGYRKFISTTIAYALSRVLDRRKFEVVQEGNLDLHNPDSDSPDITVYERERNNEPVLLIELCFNANEQDTVTTVEIIREIYSIKEAFVFNIESDNWIGKTQSHLFNIDLSNLLNNQLLKYF